jgi:hypothetical protein
MLDMCQKTDCEHEAKYGPRRNDLKFCRKHRKKDVDLRWEEICQSENCKEIATYGLNFDTAIHCAEHKIGNEYEVIRKCEIELCNNKSSFSDNKYIPKRCDKHKSPSTKEQKEYALSKMCYEYDCLNKATYSKTADDKPILCTEHKLSNMIKKGRVCTFIDSENNICQITATYGLANAKSTRCFRHKEEDHISRRIKNCQCEENKNTAMYGPIEDYKNKPPIWCINCRPDDETKWISYAAIKCEAKDCKVVASYGPDNGKNMRCATHKLDNDISYKMNRCKDCKEKASKYKLENLSDPKGASLRLCETCVTNYENHEDKIHINKRCECGKHSPSYGFVENGKMNIIYCKLCNPDTKKYQLLRAKKCVDCGEVSASMSDTNERKWCATCAKKHENATNVVSKLCIVCQKVQATFGDKGHAPQWCVKCKPDNKISLNGVFCNKCDTRASFGKSFGSKPITCFDHREQDYVSTAFRQCEVCIRENTGTINYAYYSEGGTLASAQRCGYHQDSQDCAYHRLVCTTCKKFHTRQHSDLCCECDPTARVKVHEKTVVDYLRSLENYKNFKYDTIIVKNTEMYGKFRPDICYELKNYNIIVEVDENAHSDYYGEKDRMINITAGCGKFCVFIRYNPDKIYFGDRDDLCVDAKTRLKLLIERIDYHRNNPPQVPLVCEYLFYKCTIVDKNVNYIHTETDGIPVRISKIDLGKINKILSDKNYTDVLLDATKICSGKILLTLKCQCGEIFKKIKSHYNRSGCGNNYCIHKKKKQKSKKSRR